PGAPAVAQSVQFNASASTAASGHTITRYSWNFGDGSTDATTSPTTSHSYSSAGARTVTLVVTDDVGQTHTTTGTVTVLAGIAAAFTVSPTNPNVVDTVQFNGSGSTTTSGSTITKYQWDFGDGTTEDTGTTATTSHKYSLGGGRIYTVRLTITDSAGRTATTTATVTVTG
ncbi:MAG: PKD domain-containing protein, partial [Acidobacteria bacterium]|nr:PKD domain-containing protein [Acidobacteriota bacterium]